MNRTFVFMLLMFVGSSTASDSNVGQQIEIGADLGLNISKIRQDLKECSRLLRMLDANRTVNSSQALGLLGLRTGFKEYAAFFRSNQPCSNTAFNEVNDATYFGAETYSQCVNAYPARPTDVTSRPVSIYTYFRKCFQTIFKINAAVRECTSDFNIGILNFLFGRVNVTLLEEVRVGKCADTAMNEVIEKLNVTVSIYKLCRYKDLTTQTPTTPASTVPPYFAIINAALVRFDQSYSTSISRLQSLVSKAATDVNSTLTEVKAMNVSDSMASIESTESKVVSLIKTLATRETATEQQKSCANVSYAELANLTATAKANIQSCITHAITNITALLQKAVNNEGYVNSRIHSTGRQAIIRCANSLYSLPDEAVRCCTETVLEDFGKYMNEKSDIDIDNSITLANNATGQSVKAKKCLDSVIVDFTQKSTAVYSSFRSCGGFF